MSQSYEVSQSGNNNSNIINNSASKSIVINSKSYNFSNNHINNLINNYNMQKKQQEISNYKKNKTIQPTKQNFKLIINMLHSYKVIQTI